MQSGAWVSDSYRNYIGLLADEALVIAALLLAGHAADSEDSDPVPTRANGAPKKQIPKRARDAPIDIRHSWYGVANDDADPDSSNTLTSDWPGLVLGSGPIRP